MDVFRFAGTVGREEMYYRQRNKPAKILINFYCLIGRQDGSQYQRSPAIKLICIYPIILSSRPNLWEEYVEANWWKRKVERNPC